MFTLSGFTDGTKGRWFCRFTMCFWTRVILNKVRLQLKFKSRIILLNFVMFVSMIFLFRGKNLFLSSDSPLKPTIGESDEDFFKKLNNWEEDDWIVKTIILSHSMTLSKKRWIFLKLSIMRNLKLIYSSYLKGYNGVAMGECGNIEDHVNNMALLVEE